MHHQTALVIPVKQPTDKMPYAEFMPAVPAGSLLPRAAEYAGQQQSLMERADEQRIRDAQEKRAQAQSEILMPVIQAQSQANIATAHASITNAAMMQNLRTQAAATAAPANNEFLDAQKIPDFAAKADAMSALQAKYSWMEQLPEYKGFVTAVNDARLQAHASALANMHLTTQLAVAKTASDERLAQAQLYSGARIESAKIAADTKLQAANFKSTAPTAAIKDINYYVDSVANGDEDQANYMQGILQRRAGITPTEIMSGLGHVADREIKLSKAAADSGDEAATKEHLDRANAIQKRISVLSQQKPAAIATPHAGTGSGGKPPTPDEVRKLPAGTIFRGPDGKLWRAKGAPQEPPVPPPDSTDTENQ